jgi:hypothetical protein
MGEAELAHESKSLIPSLKWLEIDPSEAFREGGWLERSIALCYEAGAYGQAPETV